MAVSRVSLADSAAQWTGAYRLRVATPTGQTDTVIRVTPSKISLSAFAQLLDDLERGLPAAVALALKRSGALSGIDIVPPQQTTLAAELARLRRAVLGTGEVRPGLALVLEHLAQDHYEVLATQEQWLPSERASVLAPHGWRRRSWRRATWMTVGARVVW